MNSGMSRLGRMPAAIKSAQMEGNQDLVFSELLVLQKTIKIMIGGTGPLPDIPLALVNVLQMTYSSQSYIYILCACVLYDSARARVWDRPDDAEKTSLALCVQSFVYSCCLGNSASIFIKPLSE